jgi:xanthine dehydrogenase YagR molybdenum-binding subunit
MSTTQRPRAVGRDLTRADAPLKVRGVAPYATEHDLDAPLYAHAVQSTIACGVITAIDTTSAEALAGVVRTLTHTDAERLANDEDAEMWILQSPAVHFRGQVIGVVVAETAEVAREAASLVRVSYEQARHDVALAGDKQDLYAPEEVNPDFPTDTVQGDVEAALADAAVVVDETYRTAMMHNNPMEPHATVAHWDPDRARLTLHDSTQGVHSVASTIAPLFGLEKDQVHVIAPYVGGGFGSKGMPHSHVVLAALAARAVSGRHVKLPLTRQQMFALVGYRTPTIQHVRLGASADGRLLAIGHDVVEQTSRIKEFAEQTAVATRMMYAAPNRATSHRLAPLDVPVPSWMRAPGECPGMFAPEVALDELAIGLDLDPLELRIRNEPEVDPDTGNPWSSRGLVNCLRQGAERFGWADRDPAPRTRLEHGWWVGTGVASSVYPVYRMSGTSATIRRRPDGRYAVHIGAADIGTGAWTILAQIAADALQVAIEDIVLGIGDTDLPPASVAGGSSGTTTWGSAIVAAAQAFHEEHGEDPPAGAETTAETPENPAEQEYAMYAFGAQFAEVRVHADTGELRVPRLTGVFAAGRIINPRTARSQFLGGMTMGLSMALHERSVMDLATGHVVTDDLADYHVAAHADMGTLEAHWIDEDDPHVNPMGSKGIGEIGVVGTAAAVANAVHHATGIRVRELPLTLDKLLDAPNWRGRG